MPGRKEGQVRDASDIQEGPVFVGREQGPVQDRSKRSAATSCCQIGSAKL